MVGSLRQLLVAFRTHGDGVVLQWTQYANGEHFRGEGKDGCTVKVDVSGGGVVAVECVFLSFFFHFFHVC